MELSDIGIGIATAIGVILLCGYYLARRPGPVCPRCKSQKTDLIELRLFGGTLYGCQPCGHEWKSHCRRTV